MEILYMSKYNKAKTYKIFGMFLQNLSRFILRSCPKYIREFNTITSNNGLKKPIKMSDLINNISLN